MDKVEKIVIIGGGFSSLSAAAYLAKAGFDVTLLEKNDTVGGRARQWEKDGFTFDMGPTFYWMPDVMEDFFKDFGKRTKDYFTLNKLNPAYKVFFGKGQTIAIGDRLSDIVEVFEKVEAGSGEQLKKFIKEAEDNYNLAIKKLVYQPGENIFEITSLATLQKLNLFLTTIKQNVAKYIKNKMLQQLLEFPVLFLGATPSTTPAFYNFMNYADFGLGTWHPQGGMYQLPKAMESLAESFGVRIVTDAAVEKVQVENGNIRAVKTKDRIYNCDILLSGADYHHTESLLPKANRQFSENYWEKKTFAPSALLFYVAFDKKLINVAHHTLFFDTDFEEHANTIYRTKSWPTKPLFYASFPSITDESVAPKGKEAGIFLIPIAPDAEDTAAIREKYFKKIIKRLEMLSEQSVEDSILFQRSYCVNDFKADYNSYKGNAYGLANTLMQTHLLRPKLHSKKVKNLYFTGQLTVPGPGIPPSIISGKIVSKLIIRDYEKTV